MVLPMMSISDAREKILKKGDVLLVLPVMVQFGLIVLMSVAVFGVKDEVDERMRSKAVVHESNALNKLFYDAGVALGGYSVTKSPTFSDRYTKIVKEIPESLSELRDLVDGDEAKQEQLEKITEVIDEGLAMLSDSKKAIDTNSADVGQSKAKQMYKRLGQLDRQLEDKISIFIADYRKGEHFESAAYFSSISLGVFVLIVWLVVCVLLLVVLFVFFRISVGDIFAGLGSFTNKSGDMTKPAFGSRVWQTKRQRYGKKRSSGKSEQNAMVSVLVSSTRVKMSILGKGYALLLLPLMVHFCLLFTLTGLLREAEEEVQEQIRSKAIISQANALSKLFYDAGVAMGGYSITKSPLFSDRFEMITRQIPIDVSELRNLVADDADKQVQVQHISEITKDGLKILAKAREAIDNDLPVASRRCRPRAMYKQIRQLADQLQSELRSLTFDYRCIEGRSPEQQNRYRTLVKVLLVGWLIFNVLLSFALFADFRKAVVRNLARAIFPRDKKDKGGTAVVAALSFPRQPSSVFNRPAFGSKTWQAKRQRYVGKPTQVSARPPVTRPRP